MLGTAVVALVAAVVRVVAWDWTLGHILRPIGKGLARMSAEPIGFAGAILLAAVLLMVVLAFADTSPVAAVIKSWLRTFPKARVPAEELARARQQLEEHLEALRFGERCLKGL